jgi:antitoxin YefM
MPGMDAVTYTHARNNLAATMDKTIEDHEPVIITRQNGKAVVMMSLEDFQSWEETAYLLASPANARALMQSLEEARRGERVEPSKEAWTALRDKAEWPR